MPECRICNENACLCWQRPQASSKATRSTNDAIANEHLSGIQWRSCWVAFTSWIFSKAGNSNRTLPMEFVSLFGICLFERICWHNLSFSKVKRIAGTPNHNPHRLCQPILVAVSRTVGKIKRVVSNRSWEWQNFRNVVTGRSNQAGTCWKLSTVGTRVKEFIRWNVAWPWNSRPPGNEQRFQIPV